MITHTQKQTTRPFPSLLPPQALSHFNAYNARFRMPSLESGAAHGTAMWFSFNLGPVHWVVIDTETDFPEAPEDKYTWWGDDDGVGNGGFGDQTAWLVEVKRATTRAVSWAIHPCLKKQKIAHFSLTSDKIAIETLTC